MNEGSRGSTFCSWNYAFHEMMISSIWWKPWVLNLTVLYFTKCYVRKYNRFFQAWQIHGIDRFVCFFFLAVNWLEMSNYECQKMYSKYICKLHLYCLTLVEISNSAQIQNRTFTLIIILQDFLQFRINNWQALSHRPANDVWSRQGGKTNPPSCIQLQCSYCYLNR